MHLTLGFRGLLLLSKVDNVGGEHSDECCNLRHVVVHNLIELGIGLKRAYYLDHSSTTKLEQTEYTRRKESQLE